MSFENLTELAPPPVQAPVATQDLHVVELPTAGAPIRWVDTQNLNAAAISRNRLGFCVDLPGMQPRASCFRRMTNCMYCKVRWVA